MSKRTNFRNRKISVKQALGILKWKDVDKLEEDLLNQAAAAAAASEKVESGVDKEEENETHLVAAMNASGFQKTANIPTPDASQVVPDYDKKFRTAHKTWTSPSTLIRSSLTVEETEGCPYCMDEQDEEWLDKFNVGRKGNTAISEEAFECIIQQFELTINVKQPFLSTAPDSILPFEELQSAFDDEQAIGRPHKAYAKFVYPHWRDRRVANGGRPIMPMLRFEENAKDDGDPYVCFRRREVRQMRKTRQTGHPATTRVRALRNEMQQARDLADMVLRRERLKREVLLVNQAIFEKRCLVKDLKRKLNIRSDDDLLVTQKRRKSVDNAIATPVSKLARANSGAQHSASQASGRAGDVANESNLVSIDEYFEERNAKARAEMAEKLGVPQIPAQELGWIDRTDSPYIPTPRSFASSFFRLIKTLYVGATEVTATASAAHADLGPDANKQHDKAAPSERSVNIERSADPNAASRSKLVSSMRPNSADRNHQQQQQQPQQRMRFRQRIGRGGRIMVDRRSIPSRQCHHYLPQSGPFLDPDIHTSLHTKLHGSTGGKTRGGLGKGKGKGKSIGGKGKGKGKGRGGWFDRWAFDRDDSDDESIEV
ncbi:Enhancer of polycomb-like protein 1 [Savitreella phatthalungensis]